MLRYTFIFNPAARLGAVARHEQNLRRAIERAGLDGEVILTTGPRHAVLLAREAARRADVVVAVGGDGTVHEVAKGLASAGTDAAMGVVALGTGNDFAKMLGLPVGLAAVPALATAQPVMVDYGIATWDEAEGTAEGFFCNGLGVGFDAQVAARAPRYKKLPGVAAYLCAVVDTLARWQSPRVRIYADDAAVHDGPMLLAAIGNGTTAGGGFVLTPGASITDGRLDLCAIRDATRGRVLQLLPRVLRGTHIHAPEVLQHTFTTLVLESETPVAVHADGEMLARATQRVSVRVVPAGLRVLCAPQPAEV